MQQTTHENFSREEPSAPGSERLFGIVMSVALALISSINYWCDGRWWPWMVGIAALFLAAAFLYSAVLKPLPGEVRVITEDHAEDCICHFGAFKPPR